jgi:hypothetical protein
MPAGSGEAVGVRLVHCHRNPLCATPIAPPDLVRLRAQRPTGPVKAPAFDEQSLPVHFECLAGGSGSRLF